MQTPKASANRRRRRLQRLGSCALAHEPSRRQGRFEEGMFPSSTTEGSGVLPREILSFLVAFGCILELFDRKMTHYQKRFLQSRVGIFCQIGLYPYHMCRPISVCVKRCRLRYFCGMGLRIIIHSTIVEWPQFPQR